MNKRFFTLMAAVMLAGSPFASDYAFADNAKAVEVTVDTKLASGLKFIMKGTNFKTVQVIDDTNYVKIVDDATDVVEEKATKFEIRSYSNGTFQLWAKNKQVAVLEGNKYVTTFAAVANDAITEKLNAMTAIKVAKIGSFGAPAVDGISAYTLKKIYKEADFKDYNKNNVTLSFNASNLEGNVFEGLKAWTPAEHSADASAKFAVWADPDNSEALTYLVKATADDFAAFVGDPTNKDKAAKVSFVYVKDERYDINGKIAHEGYKVVLVNGADFFPTDGTQALSSNAAFTSITEADQLNAEGALSLKISPKVTKGNETAIESVEIVAVKPSASDTKTYVTTIAENTTFKNIIYPTLGSNTYFAASEFLKVNQVSAYNIYFTKGTASSSSVDGEYHKYLAVADHEYALGDEETNLVALAANSIDLNTPYAQWIVTDFNNKYTLTLENRADDSVLKLRLAATSTANVYDVISEEYDEADEASLIYVGSKNATGVGLAGAQIKLIPATLTKTDGFLTLTDQQLEEGIELSFTGKDYQLGTPTYYATYGFKAATEDDNTSYWKLVPSTEGGQKLAVEAYEDTNKDYLIEKEALALNANGQLISKVDTLIAPAYLFFDAYEVENYADVNLGYTAAKATAAKFFFIKSLNGQYVMSSDTPNDDQFDGLAYGVDNKSFTHTADVCSPAADAFAYVGVDAFDNYDYSSLDPVSRHATLETQLGAVSMQLNNKGVIEGILAAEPLTFWLDTADSESNHPSFYISKGIPAEEEEVTKADEEAEARLFLYMPADSASYFDEASATSKKNSAYYLEGTSDSKYKAIFRPAALVAEDTLATVKGDKEVLVVTEKADAAKGQVNGLKNFQYNIVLADDEVEDEYVVKSKANNQYLFSLNGKLGFTGNKGEALVVTIGAGDPTANEAIEAESSIAVIGGQGVVTVQGAAGKVITVANILGQTIANQVAASDNVTIAAPAGIVVVSVDGEATKVIVK